jgi:RHS repeat-associated protein
VRHPPYTNTWAQNYKFEGKERDTETGNDDFGARYYSNRFGRWLSADWSSVPVAVPYANLTNPQTLNLYSMVADDPESFADLDGHLASQGTAYPGDGGGPSCASAGAGTSGSVANGCGPAPQAADQAQQAQATVGAGTVVKETMEQIDKVVKPLIESAAEEAGAAAGVLSKVAGAAVGVLVELATAPATARDEDKLKDVQKKDDKGDKDKEHTKEPSPSKWDKHTKPHPSRTGDKLRDRPDWQPKKGKGGPRSPGSKRDKTDDE